MGTIPAFGIFQGKEKPRDSAGARELRADCSHRCPHDHDAPIPFELFQHHFTGTRALPFASGFPLAAAEANTASHQVWGFERTINL